jgi:hypothetical protein
LGLNEQTSEACLIPSASGDEVRDVWRILDRCVRPGVSGGALTPDEDRWVVHAQGRAPRTNTLVLHTDQENWCGPSGEQAAVAIRSVDRDATRKDRLVGLDLRQFISHICRDHTLQGCDQFRLIHGRPVCHASRPGRMALPIEFLVPSCQHIDDQQSPNCRPPRGWTTPSWQSLQRGGLPVLCDTEP